jgi:hypothetical protein
MKKVCNTAVNVLPRVIILTMLRNTAAMHIPKLIPNNEVYQQYYCTQINAFLNAQGPIYTLQMAKSFV